MVTVHLAQQSTGVGSPLVNITVFGAFVLLTLVVVYRAGRSNRTATDYYTAGSRFTGAQNGVALAGDYLSAAAFLGIAGAVALAGYDGLLYAIGAFVGWLVALLLVAERLRNTGRFTMGDVLSYRLRQRPVRSAAATSTLMISLIYMIAQVAGAGGLIALLLGIPNTNRLGQSLVIAGVGVLMLAYVLVGGMRGTTWVQILKANLLIVTGLVLAAWVIGRYGFNFSALLGDAVDNSPKAGERLLAPGLLYGQTELAKIDFISLSLAALLGPASLPHILMRFYTVPNAQEARRSVVWAIWMIGAFFLMVVVIGYGAAALVGGDAIKAAPGASNSAAPLLAFRLGGELLLGIVAAVAFATILAVVAGLTITASASFAHDVYANVIKRGAAEPVQEVRVARATAVVVGLLATGGGILANGQNVAVLVALAFAVAASANMPSLLFALFWRRFNTMGALFSMYGGMFSALVLVILSPAVSGSPTSMLPGVDFAYFPLSNPGIVSIPLSFLLAVVGTFVGGKELGGSTRFAEMEVRAMTGASGPSGRRGPGRTAAPARRRCTAAGHLRPRRGAPRDGPGPWADGAPHPIASAAPWPRRHASVAPLQQARTPAARARAGRASATRPATARGTTSSSPARSPGWPPSATSWRCGSSCPPPRRRCRCGRRATCPSPSRRCCREPRPRWSAPAARSCSGCRSRPAPAICRPTSPARWRGPATPNRAVRCRSSAPASAGPTRSACRTSWNPTRRWTSRCTPTSRGGSPSPTARSRAPTCWPPSSGPTP